jgi:hypothetical protein
MESVKRQDAKRWKDRVEEEELCFRDAVSRTAEMLAKTWGVEMYALKVKGKSKK